MSATKIIAAIVATVVVAGLAGSLWYLTLGRPPHTCALSGRPIHENMRTVVRINGRTVHACCPRCPLTVARQAGETVEFLRVTDFVTSRPLDPRDAFFVSESHVKICYAPPVKIDEAHTPYRQIFDQCGPSLIAFARETDARAFAVENGGHIVHLSDLLGELAGAASDAERGSDR